MTIERVDDFWVEAAEIREFPWGFEVWAAVFADEAQKEHLRTFEFSFGKDKPADKTVVAAIQKRLDALRTELSALPIDQDKTDKNAAIETLKRLKVSAEEVAAALAAEADHG